MQLFLLLSTAFFFYLALTKFVSASTCVPDGYTPINSTHFIKAVAALDSMDGHLAKAQTEAAVIGKGVIGRLGIITNQSVDELAKNLTLLAGSFQSWIGLKCLEGNCGDLDRWIWTEDGVSEYMPPGWLPAAMNFDPSTAPKCMRINLVGADNEWNDNGCVKKRGAIYELVARGDPCETVTCADDEQCVPPVCFLDEPRCQPNFRPCPDNPQGFEYGDHCYWIEDIGDTDLFENARMSCGEGAMLATPIHPEVRRLIFAKMQENTLSKLWIGLMQTGEKNGNVGDGWEIFDPYFGRNIPIESAFIPWITGTPNDADNVENGNEDNAVMTNEGYFADKDSNMASSNAGAACQKKLYLTEHFTLVGFGERIISPITGQIDANSVGKCARECYGSWACNAVSYGNSNECYFHLLAKEDHGNVTAIVAPGFQILKRVP